MEEKMRFPAIFGIVVGIGMIGQWLMSYFSKQIPELKTEPIRIGFHLAAEASTAVMLIVSGILMLTGAGMGQSLFLIAAGMMFYTCIVSPGYFAQQGKWAWLVMFSALIIAGIFAALTIIM